MYQYKIGYHEQFQSVYTLGRKTLIKFGLVLHTIIKIKI